MTNPTRSSSDAGTGMVGVLAEVLGEHRAPSGHVNDPDCACGWEMTREQWESAKSYLDERETHLAAVLAAALGERGES